jgi:hypothetical protein
VQLFLHTFSRCYPRKQRVAYLVELPEHVNSKPFVVCGFVLFACLFVCLNACLFVSLWAGLFSGHAPWVDYMDINKYAVVVTSSYVHAWALQRLPDGHAPLT